MEMTIYNYDVYIKGNKIAGFENFDLAKEYAKSWTNAENCNAFIVDAFTGEVLYESDVLIIKICNSKGEEIERAYEFEEHCSR